MRSGIITIIVVTSLLAIGLFSIMGINMTGSNGQHSCPISALSSDNCSPSNNPLTEAFHHISGLQNLTQRAVNVNASLSMLLTLLVLAFSVFATYVSTTPSLQVSSRRGRYATEEPNPSKKRLLLWLALHEKRDPYALQGVHDYS